MHLRLLVVVPARGARQVFAVSGHRVRDGAGGARQRAAQRGHSVPETARKEHEHERDQSRVEFSHFKKQY